MSRFSLFVNRRASLRALYATLGGRRVTSVAAAGSKPPLLAAPPEAKAAALAAALALASRLHAVVKLNASNVVWSTKPTVQQKVQGVPAEPPAHGDPIVPELLSLEISHGALSVGRIDSRLVIGLSRVQWLGSSKHLLK